MIIPVEIISDGIDWAVLAAWVQGIGSVVAIGAAIFISSQERRHAQRERKAAEEAFALLAIGLATQALELSRDAQNGLERREIKVSEDNVATVLDTLDRLPMEKMPTAEFALAYVNVRRALYFYGQAYEKAIKVINSGGNLNESGNLQTVLFNMAQSVSLQLDRMKAEGVKLGVMLGTRPDNDIYRAIRAHNPGGSPHG